MWKSIYSAHLDEFNAKDKKWIKDKKSKIAAANRAVFFKEEEHHYFYKGQQMISVSERLAFLREGLISFENMPDVIKKGAERGSAVHHFTEEHDLGIETINLDNFDAEIAPYLKGYLRFLEDEQPIYLGVETKVYVTAWETAGTIDRVYLKHTKDGGLRLGILDIKTGQHNHKNILQINLYAQMLMRLTGIKKPVEKLLLYLHKDGKYKLRKIL